MKIAQVAPLCEAVPPKLYGGTERIVSYLTEELLALGNDVTLFASGDSVSRAQLVAPVAQALRLDPTCEDMIAPHLIQLADVVMMADEFDFIHFHTDYLNFLLSEYLKTPHLTTLHGKLTIPELQLIYNRFPNQPVVSISNAQRKPLPQANFIATVHHGLPKNLYSLNEGRAGYFAFLGRISPEKRCDRAIQIALACNTTIKIAAKVDKVDRDYFEKEIRQLLDHPLVDFVGEINEDQKQDFLGNAKALLFPIDWPEPFGLVMIEAMACGTPVVAWNAGSVPEIIEQGKNGFIVNTMEEAIEAAQQAAYLSRKVVRAIFEKRFTARRMAEEYLAIYQKLCLKNMRAII
jgi:glycosyltransferase involved in cell wall biosynthesis